MVNGINTQDNDMFCLLSCIVFTYHTLVTSLIYYLLLYYWVS